MASSQKYLNHLLQGMGITPACSEEERTAADDISAIFRNHGFEPEIQEFSASNGAKTSQMVTGVLLFLGTVLMFGGGAALFIGFLLSLAAVVIYAIERSGRPVISGIGNGGLSQNVIAYHKASGPLASPRNRPVVVMAHYDSPRADLLSQPPFAAYRPAMARLFPYAMAIPAVTAVLRLLPLPGAVKVILWLLALASSLIPLANAVSIIANRFALPYTSGAVCNKSSVASMLGVMDQVAPFQGGEEFPSDVPFGEYMAQQQRLAASMMASEHGGDAPSDATGAAESPYAAGSSAGGSSPLSFLGKGIKDLKDLIPKGEPAEDGVSEYPEGPATVAGASGAAVQAPLPVAPTPAEAPRHPAAPSAADHPMPGAVPADSASAVHPADGSTQAIDAEALADAERTVETEAVPADAVATGLDGSRPVEPAPALRPASEAVPPAGLEASPSAASTPVTAADANAPMPPVSESNGERGEQQPISLVNAEGNYRYGESEIRALGMLDSACVLEYESDAMPAAAPSAANATPSAAPNQTASIVSSSTSSDSSIEASAVETRADEAPAEHEVELPRAVEDVAGAPSQEAVDDGQTAASADSVADDDFFEAIPERSDENASDGPVGTGHAAATPAEHDLSASDDGGQVFAAAPAEDDSDSLVDSTASDPDTTIQTTSNPPQASDGSAGHQDEVVSAPQGDAGEPSVANEPAAELVAGRSSVSAAEPHAEQSAESSSAPTMDQAPAPKQTTPPASDDADDSDDLFVPSAVAELVEEAASASMEEWRSASPECGVVPDQGSDVDSRSRSDAGTRQDAEVPGTDATAVNLPTDAAAPESAEFASTDESPKTSAPGAPAPSVRSAVSAPLPVNRSGSTEVFHSVESVDATRSVPAVDDAGADKTKTVVSRVIETVDSLMAEISTPAAPAARPKRSLSVPSTVDDDGNAGAIHTIRQIPPVVPDASALQGASALSRTSLFDIPDPSVTPQDPFAAPDGVDVPSPSKSGFSIVPPVESAQPAPAPAAEPTVAHGAVGVAPVDPGEESANTLQAAKDEEDKPRGLARFFGRKKKRQQSMSEWLGVEEDFDAKRDGSEIGSWDNFDSDDDGWKGGATGPEGTSEEDLRGAITSMGDDELLGHDIWFVATGASEFGNAGARAFLETHREKLRGVFIINLESVGAGRLSMLSSEGSERVLKGDKRIMRLMQRVSGDFHHELGAVDMPFVDTDAHAAMEMSLRALTVAGVDAQRLACSHTEEDQPFNVDAGNVQMVTDIVTEVIRRS